LLRAGADFSVEFPRKIIKLLDKVLNLWYNIGIMKKEVAGMKKPVVVVLVKDGKVKLIRKEELMKYVLIGEIPKELALVLEHILTCLEIAKKN